jgi:polyhydroxyalkanoate synthesis regulator phasin
MSSDPITQTLQKGFRMAIGAGASFVESVQDAQKWDENLQKLTTDFESLSQEWEAKGTQTEQEARTVVDSWVSQQGFSQGFSSGAAGGSPNTVTTTASTVATPDVEADLKDLTEQVSALRAELEDLKKQG